MPPAAKQYLPVIPTADGPKAVHESAPVARPDQLTPAARESLKGSSGSQLRQVATARSLGAPARTQPKSSSGVEGDRPGAASATVGALGDGAVIALLAALALATALLVYLSRSRRGTGSGSSTS
jgi:hypothetical protein